jgi:hypothetical protein
MVLIDRTRQRYLISEHMSNDNIYNQNRPRKSSGEEDRQLVVDSVRKAGGQKALAKVFGVAQSAISEWGRTRPIPRHVKPRLEDYLKRTSGRVEGNEKTPPRKDTAILPAALEELVRMLRSDLASRRVAHLPPRARRRYEERGMEILARVRRELLEFQAVLEAERPPRRHRRPDDGSEKPPKDVGSG